MPKSIEKLAFTKWLLFLLFEWQSLSWPASHLGPSTYLVLAQAYVLTIGVSLLTCKKHKVTGLKP